MLSQKPNVTSIMSRRIALAGLGKFDYTPMCVRYVPGRGQRIPQGWRCRERLALHSRT
jgi:hypothetical protein